MPATTATSRFARALLPLHIDVTSLQEVGAGIKRALDEGVCTRQELFVTTKVCPLLRIMGVLLLTSLTSNAALEHVPRA